MAVTFQNLQCNFRLKNKRTIAQWLKKVAVAEGQIIKEINYLFTNDEELLKKNIEFLDHDTLTDIITFGESVHGVITGDIIISVDRVRENAEKFDVMFDNELQRVMVHGLLHLCGYGDKSNSAKKKMRQLEDKYLNNYK